MVQLGTQAERITAWRRAVLQSQGRLHYVCLFAMGPFLPALQPGFCPPINQAFPPELLSPPSAPFHLVTTPAGSSFKIPWEVDAPAKTPRGWSPAEGTGPVAWLLRPSDTTYCTREPGATVNRLGHRTSQAIQMLPALAWDGWYPLCSKALSGQWGHPSRAWAPETTVHRDQSFGR